MAAKRRRRRFKSRRKTRRNQIIRLAYIGIICMIGISVIIIGKKLLQQGGLLLKNTPIVTESYEDGRPDMAVDLLTVNEYSRPGSSMNQVKGIVVHYTANPGSTAVNNRDYFEGLKDSGAAKVSSHFVIGMDGEIVQCIPTSEVAYASNDRNFDTIAIECCHPDETGALTKDTYRSLVELTAWLCEKFGLDQTDLLRHYDITGKDCPRYFVQNEDKWQDFLGDVEKTIKK